MDFNSPNAVTPSSHCLKSRYATGEVTTSTLLWEVGGIIRQRLEHGQGFALDTRGPRASNFKNTRMRIRLKKSLMVPLLLIGGPAVLIVFSQLRGNIAPL